MTYNVFGGTLNLAQSNPSQHTDAVVVVGMQRVSGMTQAAVGAVRVDAFMLTAGVVHHTLIHV